MASDFNDLLDSAFLLHKQGKFDEAKVIYEKFIQLYPDNLDAINLYAQLLLQVGDFDNSIYYFEKVYSLTKLESIKFDIAKVYYFKGDATTSLEHLNSINQKSIDVYSLISNVSLQLGDVQGAINANLEIIKQNPNFFDVIYNVSILYANINNFDNSLKYALDAFELNNSDINLLLHIASLYDVLGEKILMLDYLEKVLALNPNNELLLAKMGIEYTSVKNPVKAVSCYEKCLQLNEDNYDALVNLAVLLIDIKKFDVSIQLCNRALKISPNNIRTYHSLFLVYKAMNDVENAISSANKMIQVDSKNHLGYGCIADIYFDYINYSEALKFYNIALSFVPNELSYLYNKACCLNLLDLEDEALAVIDKILSIDSNYVLAISLKTFIYLKRKKYDLAMQTYPFILQPQVKRLINKNRFSNNLVDKKTEIYYSSRWSGEDITDKVLLLYNNDGYGDSLMFSRYIPILQKKSKQLIIETDKNLYELYKYNFPTVDVVLETSSLFSHYDCTISSMDVLYSASVGFDEIPYSKGWLNVPDSQLKKFKFDNKKLKVGFFWQGNKQILKNRFISISDLIPLFEMQNYQFYSLDITDKDDETNAIFDKYSIVDCKNIISDFYDTASIIMNLDFVVTIDSSIVHLSGALGKKTYLLLPKNTEWRWFNDNSSTPWYDSVHIFKQERQSDWNTVISKLKEELQ